MTESEYIMQPGKILVRRIIKQESDGELLMPDSVKPKPTTGIVEGFGEDIVFVVVGDIVYFNEYSGLFLEDGTGALGEESELIVLDLDEILAKKPASARK